MFKDTCSFAERTTRENKNLKSNTNKKWEKGCTVGGEGAQK